MHLLLLAALQKAVTSEVLHDQQLVKEDLEVEAHNTLWEETDPQQLTLLKMLPSRSAKQVLHQFQQVTSYGSRRGTAFVSETAVPSRVTFGTERRSVNVRLMGLRGPTYLLASMEEVVEALGADTPQGINRVGMRRNLLERTERNIILSDTRTTRLQDNSLKFKGLIQSIEEGTDGTTGRASPYGSHVIDMEGQPLTVDTMREKMAQGITMYGMFSELFMDPFVRADFEGSMDPSQRINLPLSGRPYMLGQQIAGLQTQSGVAWFNTDNQLSPIHLWMQYTSDVEELEEGYPTGLPTVTASAGSGSGSKWDSDSAGEIFWVVTEVKEEKEGLGTRYPPAAGTTTVAAGQIVTLTVTPSQPLIDSFKIYRGNEDDGTDAEDAWFIFEYRNPGTGAPVSIVDRNEWRPNHGLALGLRIVSAATEGMHTADGYFAARARSADFLSMPDSNQNTVTTVHLGPKMGLMELARVVPTIDNPMLFSALAVQVRNPYQNFVFKNIGRA